MNRNFPLNLPGPEPAESTDHRYRQFMKLFSRDESRIYSFIASQVINWNDADDLFQETNIRLWEQFDRYRPGTDFGAWACTVAYFQIKTYRAKNHRSKLVFGEEFSIAISTAYMETAESEDERRAVLNTCIEKLSETSRGLLRDCYQPDARIKEVAKKMGRKPTAVSKSLQRIRAVLHRCIESQLRPGAQS